MKKNKVVYIEGNDIIRVNNIDKYICLPFDIKGNELIRWIFKKLKLSKQDNITLVVN